VTANDAEFRTNVIAAIRWMIDGIAGLMIVTRSARGDRRSAVMFLQLLLHILHHQTPTVSLASAVTRTTRERRLLERRRHPKEAVTNDLAIM
jgi:hypothetical protein